VPDDIDQLDEHLRFFGELGVAGVSRDPAWRRRGDTLIATATPATVTDEFPPGSTDSEPAIVHVARNAEEALQAVRTDIGEDCSRCVRSFSGSVIPMPI
jgi:hypothetical protein